MMKPAPLITNVSMNVTRDGAKKTVEHLISVHSATIREIDLGHIFFKNGEDVSQEIKKRCLHEIEMCRHVLTALDHMKAGDIKRAADLCSEIATHLPNPQ